MKVLILKPSSLGDVIQALPVLRLIKQHRPDSEIRWWIDSGLTSLLDGDPDLAGLIPFERRRWGSPWRWGEVWQSVRHIRSFQFDWVIDLQSLLRSATVAWLANGSRTVGLADPREGAAAFYDVAVPRPGRLAHAVDWYLQVLPELGVPVHSNFDWLPARPAVLAEVEALWNPQPKTERWIALQPGARWDNKRWPADSYFRVAKELAARHADVRFAIFGSREDHALGEAIATAAPGRCLDLCGKTSLPQLIEWLRLCSVIVTNDTGPMHAAAALGKPVVGIFGPTEPRRTGPYGQMERVLQDHSLPCVPCMKASCRWTPKLACLDGISPAAVVQRVEAALCG